MADPLKRILSDSREAAQVYQRLTSSSNVDEKLWEFVEMRKDHEQIAGHIMRTLRETGSVGDTTASGSWAELKKHPSKRVYEDEEVLQALCAAERGELADCEDLLSLADGDRMVHTFIASNVMPVLSAHVETLEGYLRRAQRMH